VLLGWVLFTSLAWGPVWAEGDLARDLGAGEPGLNVDQLELAVLGFEPPPDDARPPTVLAVESRDVLEPGCGASQSQTVELDLEPCPENTYFIVESPQLDAPRVFEILGIRRALRFGLPARVRTFTITFVALDGQTTLPFTVDL
jgi:hypothetical protein